MRFNPCYISLLNGIATNNLYINKSLTGKKSGEMLKIVRLRQGKGVWLSICLGKGEKWLEVAKELKIWAYMLY